MQSLNVKLPIEKKAKNLNWKVKVKISMKILRKNLNKFEFFF